MRSTQEHKYSLFYNDKSYSPICLLTATTRSEYSFPSPDTSEQHNAIPLIRTPPHTVEGKVGSSHPLGQHVEPEPSQGCREDKNGFPENGDIKLPNSVILNTMDC
ncbi:hypothetical protein TNCT_115531 [Trichonephila clavata]|uniref:Uncharacterized protein n=1 Tax=Trichonephila clavata TaxID=2740835 RepID=A0A8X6KCE5_TRICU|nr:hypothetical protein TNCT_115531 [Trichonephila clavata]